MQKLIFVSVYTSQMPNKNVEQIPIIIFQLNIVTLDAKLAGSTMQRYKATENVSSAHIFDGLDSFLDARATFDHSVEFSFLLIRLDHPPGRFSDVIRSGITFIRFYQAFHISHFVPSVAFDLSIDAIGLSSFT